MSKLPDKTWLLSRTLTLCEYTSPKNGNFGFWLYDATQGMNLAINAKSEREAFVEALEFYQTRYKQEKEQHRALKAVVDSFLIQFADTEEN